MGSERKTGVKRFSKIDAQPFRGGVNTVREKALIPSGGFSAIYDLRARHPGFERRPGCKKKHSTADSTNKVLTLYQFSKGKRTERHFFAQMSDGDVLEATDAPPTVTTGAFGSEVHDGTASQIPASWSNVDDIMIYSNGQDQHQVYAGDDNPVSVFIEYDSDGAPADFETDGYDLTQEVTDGLSSTSVTITTLDTYANNECLFICTPVPANKLTWDLGSVNNNAATGTLSYRKNDNTWADTSETDGTINSNATMGKDGSMTWDTPSDEIPTMMFGVSGYWYRWVTSAQLDNITVIGLTYGSDFNDLTNVWDGVPVPAIEVRHYDASASAYYTYSYDTIEIDDFTDSDKLYFSSYDNIDGIYVDVGEKPNLNASSVDAVHIWTGVGWTAATSVTDGTNGMTNSGWITWPRNTNAEPTHFQNARYYAHWYYLEVSATLSDDVIISIETMPFFDIDELGISRCNEVWKDRAMLSFDRWPSYIYASAKNNPNYLNGDDYGILQAGDGRSNAVVCMKRFHNELMAWQEEKGRDGGCLTLFEGYSPTTFGKLVISSKVGTLSAKSVAVVDGVLTSTATEERIKTLAFFISHYGVCVSDGRTVSIISDDIQNYFDPTQSECIRLGYEDEMWLDHDSAFNVLRLGLVSGSSATVPNVFPVFDLVDKTWSFDDPEQELSCHTEVEAASGSIPILQYGGGVDDGFIYQLNTTTQDVSTEIAPYCTIELDGAGYELWLRKLLIRMKSQTSGNCTITPYRNGVAGTDTLTLNMAAKQTNEDLRKWLVGMNVQDSHIALKIEMATGATGFYLLDLGLEMYIKEGH